MLDFKVFRGYPKDEFSPERQWTCVSVGELYFPSNDRMEPSDLVDWLTKMKAKAKKEGCENSHIDFSYNTDEFEHPTSQYLIFKGFRRETDAEYKKRLDRLILAAKSDKKIWEQKRDYFERMNPDTHQTIWEERVSKWQDAVKKI